MTGFRFDAPGNGFQLSKELFELRPERISVNRIPGFKIGFIFGQVRSSVASNGSG